MIIYITRHGQPALDDMPKGADYELPDDDYVLTPLGREQAQRLGKYLKEKGFKGKILSSPYARTMETASLIGLECGLDVTPVPPIQEKRFYPEPPCPGMTLEEMRANYPNIAPDAELPHPWMQPGGPEEHEDIRRRVYPFLDSLLADPPADEILLVGHGASVGMAKFYMRDRSGYEGDLGIAVNTSLSTFEAFPDGRVRIIELDCIKHLPVEKVTSNRKNYEELGLK